MLSDGPNNFANALRDDDDDAEVEAPLSELGRITDSPLVGEQRNGTKRVRSPSPPLEMDEETQPKRRTVSFMIIAMVICPKAGEHRKELPG